MNIGDYRVYQGLARATISRLENPVRHLAMIGCIFCLFAATFLCAETGPPLFVALSPVFRTVKKGYDVRFNVTLTNVSMRDLTFFERNPICDYPMKVRDSDGNQPPEISTIQESRCDEELQLTQARNILVTLKPGESYASETNILSTMTYDAPGYTVQVFRHLPSEIGKDDIPSNTATFVVTD